MPVIVQSLDGSGRAQSALEQFGTASSKLGIVDAAAGDVVAGDLPQLAATNPGLVITPDQPVVLDAKPDSKPKNPKNPHTPAAFTSGEDWPAAVGADQLWPALATCRARTRRARTRRPRSPSSTPASTPSRSDFGGRVLAQLDMTSLRDNSPGDGNGHGTLVAGLAAGSAPGHAGADPTAGIVSLDVMDDQGMARTSDVIAAAQWILRNNAPVQHPGRELLAPLRVPDELPLGPARQGGGEALVRRRRRRGCRRQPGPGRQIDADGLRARERPVRDHRRGARPAQLDQPRPGGCSAVVGLGLHAGRVREARAERSWPRDRPARCRPARRWQPRSRRR